MMTPMMQHYLDTKKEYPDCILFYRLGDFYEMFYEDAVTVSRELELTLTGKDCGMPERAPMCGVPHHAADVYINKLVEKGFKVAIAEQTEDPKQAKGLVRREVVRIVTPGTNMSPQALEEGRNNYIMCIAAQDKEFGLSAADVSTGEFFAAEVSSVSELFDEIYKFMPSEIIVNEAFMIRGVDTDELKNRYHMMISVLPASYFKEADCVKRLCSHFDVYSYESLGFKDRHAAGLASGAMLIYLDETQKISLTHITGISLYDRGKYMIIDTSTRRNLELTETLREKKKHGTLLWVLDRTRTAMGARLLRTVIEQPLLKKEEIIRRQDAVQDLLEDLITREELREYLAPVYDLERLMGRITFHTAGPRDLIAFKTSLEMLPHIKALLKGFKCDLLAELQEDMDGLEDICALIGEAINDDPPLSSKEGGVIKPGYSEEADRLREAKTEGNVWLKELEETEKERTGIKNLRIKYNRVFGYYLEVTNSFKDMVPEDYIRKQTLTNAERYTTPRLKELESVILGADEKLTALEYDLFCQIRDHISGQVSRVQRTAHSVAMLDVLLSLAHAAEHEHFVRPKINDRGNISIIGGRHPVVEKMMKDEPFVPNDTKLDLKDHRIAVITGPNMAGKSTYMRQTALIVLMAQTGSYVPAEKADIGICDRIFTRVGASDDLASGQSTFMVEMTEVANILRNATRNSLLILDEIGRGTSTFDGLAIAWAVVEHISQPKLIGAKTLFATHYHELTELEGHLPGVNNYCIAVKEQGDTIVFLRKIVAGGADKSYGIQVAKLAGVPVQVIERAKELVAELSDADISARAREVAETGAPDRKKHVPKPDYVDRNQLSLFDTNSDDEILKEIDELELSTMTPIDALNTLYSLQAKRKNRWQG